MYNREGELDRDKSLTLKGIAIAMMLFHHSFQAWRYAGQDLVFLPLKEHQVIDLAASCKICVSVFAFITGYGLFLAYQRKAKEVTARRWCAKRYVKSFSGYWFIWLLAVVYTQITEGRTAQRFFSEGPYRGVIYMATDFLGLSNLFGTPQLLNFAWYMSAAAVFILLVPLLWRCRDALWLMLAGAVAFPRITTAGGSAYMGGEHVYTYLTPFLLGAIFARHGLYERWTTIGSGKRWTRWYKLVVMVWLFIVGYKLYHNVPQEYYWEYHFGLLPLLFTLFCAEYIAVIPGLRRVLSILGRHSMNMWLIHWFCMKYAYAGKYFVVVTVMLVGMSLAVSVIIEVVKGALRYDQWVDRLV